MKWYWNMEMPPRAESSRLIGLRSLLPKRLVMMLMCVVQVSKPGLIVSPASLVIHNYSRPNLDTYRKTYILYIYVYIKHKRKNKYTHTLTLETLIMKL